MAAIKKFFEKKRQDAKFKKLGSGHRLCDEPAAPSPTVASGSGGRSSRPTGADGIQQTESQRAAALAAVARLDRTQNQAVAPQWSKNYIKAEARKQMSAGVNQATAAAPVQLEAPPTLAASGVYFKCPLIGPEVLPKDEMVTRIRQFLYDQLEEEPALTAVLIIYSLNRNSTKVEACVATLRKYLENIALNPDDAKYRKIKKSNRVFQERVAPVEGAELFLESAGFKKVTEDDEAFLIFPIDEDVSHFETLIDALGTAEPIVPELDRGIRVLQPSRATESMNLPSDFFVMSAEELKQEIKAREEAVEKLTQLRTKVMRERDEILEKRQYKYALIRIKFPDGVLLQGTFGVFEKLNALLEFVRENVSYPDERFKLTSPGGGFTLECPASEMGEKTLVEAKLVPATVLNFAWLNSELGGGGNTLRKDILALLESN